MEHKVFPTKVINVEGDNDRTVTGVSAVMGVIDAYGDRLWKGAFTKTISERSDRFRHLWQHDFELPPIATIKEIREIGRTDLPKDMKEKYPEAKGGLLVKREYLETERAGEVLAGLKSDPPAINEMSFGYDAVKFDFEELEEGEFSGMLIRNLKEVRLWDTSDVLWGANEATVAQMKSVQLFKDTGTIEPESEWKSPELSDFTDQEFDDLSEAEKARIAAHFTWSKHTPPQSFEDLKFAHHRPSKSGVGPAVWKGTDLAMQALIDETVDVPAKDRKSLFDHLVKHFEQYDQEAPEFKKVNIIWTVDSLLEQDLNEMPDVFEKLNQLAEILRAEPQSEAEALKALTQKSQLERELKLRQRTLALLNS